MCKIKSIKIQHFRGIPNSVELDFTQNKKVTSFLVFGDNGSGKSSIIDAIEFATLGTVQYVPSLKSDKWIYNSVSLTLNHSSKINILLTSGVENNLEIGLDYENQRAETQINVLKEFRQAPFVLRRQDIFNFWGLPNQQKLKIFRSFVITDTDVMLASDAEKIDTIESERMILKQEKREIIERLATYYKYNPVEMSTKSKSSFFADINLLEHVKSLSQIQKTNPRYGDLRRLNKIYDSIIEKNKQLREIKKAIEVPDKNSELKEVMNSISPIVTDFFKKISRTSDYVENIFISVGDQSDMSISFRVELENGKTAEPTMLFSEANRDLLALLIYFEFIFDSSKRGQAKVLVLDDIFQSIDSNIRYRIMQYVIDRFFDWQIIITTHDKLWKEQLTHLFRNHSKDIQQIEITKWSFEDGPRIVSAINNYDEKLIAAIENGSAADICASAGYMMEYICEKLSCILSTSIRRKHGDKYTIGDLWPGIYKELKKSQAKEIFSQLNDLVYLRNVAGSHYNEWSLSLSRSEAEDFGYAVLKVYYHVHCKKCGRWIKGVIDISNEEFECNCCR